MFAKLFSLNFRQFTKVDNDSFAQPHVYVHVGE
jgi:hypothetical protein